MAQTNGLDPAVADRLLELLSQDDAFRDLFQRDPTAALRQVGHETGGDVPCDVQSDDVARTDAQVDDPCDCFQVNALASKDVIQNSLEELRSMLTSGLSMNVPQLDAS